MTIGGLAHEHMAAWADVAQAMADYLRLQRHMQERREQTAHVGELTLLRVHLVHTLRGLLPLARQMDMVDFQRKNVYGPAVEAIMAACGLTMKDIEGEKK